MKAASVQIALKRTPWFLFLLGILLCTSPISAVEKKKCPASLIKIGHILRRNSILSQMQEHGIERDRLRAMLEMEKKNRRDEWISYDELASLAQPFFESLQLQKNDRRRTSLEPTFRQLSSVAEKLASSSIDPKKIKRISEFLYQFGWQTGSSNWPKDPKEIAFTWLANPVAEIEELEPQQLPTDIDSALLGALMGLRVGQKRTVTKAINITPATASGDLVDSKIKGLIGEREFRGRIDPIMGGPFLQTEFTSSPPVNEPHYKIYLDLDFATLKRDLQGLILEAKEFGADNMKFFAGDTKGRERAEKVVIYFGNPVEMLKAARIWNDRYREHQRSIDFPFTFSAKAPLYIGEDIMARSSSRERIVQAIAEGFSIFGFNQNAVPFVAAFLDKLGFDPAYFLPKSFVEKYEKELEVLRH
ncbi:MAG: hypothetical protein JWQ35_1615 [Bacteriovoracaceae bacterium]|nr:hypothetical protein [Bacteriovoracaceae bacterium]